MPQFPHLEDGDDTEAQDAGLGRAPGALGWAAATPGLWKGLWLFCLDNGSLADISFPFGFSTFLYCQNVDSQKENLKTSMDPVQH